MYFCELEPEQNDFAGDPAITNCYTWLNILNKVFIKIPLPLPKLKCPKRI